MAAFTLGNCKTLLQDLNYDDSSPRGLRLQVQIANAACQRLRRIGKWDFDRRFDTLDFDAKKTAGTVDLAAGGTTVTGTGTAFDTDDDAGGRFFRFNGEPLIYPVGAYSSATSMTIGTAYKGSAALDDATYELFHSRIALPANFRCLANPILQDGTWRLIPTANLQDMLQRLRRNRETGTPREYGIEMVPTSSTPAPWMWVYPPPINAMSIGIDYFVWGPRLSGDSDVLGLPDGTPAEEVLCQYLQGYMLHFSGKIAEGATKLAEADANALQMLGAYRVVAEDVQREEYCDPGDARNEFERAWAPGEPAFE